MNPFFTVIISVYNKASHLSKTITSVIDQSFSDFEIIIINDGSTDNSKAILDGLTDERIQIIHQSNQGVSRARNNGIALAKSDYIALLDGDDIWHPEYLKRMHDTINANSEQSVFTCAIAHKYNTTIVPVPYSIEAHSDVLILDYFKASQKHSALSGSSVVFKKEILKTTGEFDPKIRSGEDTDLWIRFGMHYPIVFICEVLVFYVFDLKSLSNTNFNIEDKPPFDSYAEAESQNIYLKRFIDRNRFSLAVMSKLNNDKEGFTYYRKALSTKNLSWKRRLILDSPRWLIKYLLRIKALGGKKLYYKPL
ncbi:glycosyltransferase family 2 protein [Psychroserpens sp.]|uniref:glycosyltransferase family 2 protein n=1 Tax=Psychroserpens sp. TaxID=2020870 RepID=UPI001B19250F|nr:glycosyltransferase family 2 protein [Psychroserpens sp.]MBO6606147.1 glycosyltransferase family 2 protein [Psychroserpens sp.]MBO6632661.1 glycosyltransferase family 2 protein [Psychroserpens sp.]MBO6652481.1 glycosyltransferase family 2 protein [Psychroserpens sp.]MBO6681747.1 glycosyltransferase family 2 protein [Psychroserpens sp.]MBO6749522.1 glycosyltransferase family 2 protein [Psychroserpens sp.]